MKNEEVRTTPKGVALGNRAPSTGQPSGIDQPAKPPVFWMFVPLLLIALAIYFAR